jgi:hypothetical protein
LAERKVSQRGLDYLPTELKRKATVVTEACLWLIKHKTGPDGLGLKLGRYKLDGGKRPEVAVPKSELTLDNEELDALGRFLAENLEPFHAGAKQWLAVDGTIEDVHIEQLQTFFASPNKAKLLELLMQHDVVPDDLLRGLQYQRRVRAVSELEDMLGGNLLEKDWQRWFERNDWILGSEFVRILDERAIDVGSIADYLMGYDGFLDLVEIKRPEGGLRFWSDAQDHGNYVPHSDLTKAITQASKYIYEVEREANSSKFIERLGGVKTIKPRCVLIYGRSSDWNAGQREAYRILNSGYYNLTILTYDHVLARARRILDLASEAAGIDAGRRPAGTEDWSEIPF